MTSPKDPTHDILTATNAVDLQIALKIVRVLMTPFEDLKAYKLGIIDKDGNQIKQSHELDTVEERNAYSALNKLLIRIKQLFIKYNIKRAQAQPFVTMAGAIKFVRESETFVGFENFLDSYSPTSDEIDVVKHICEDMMSGVATIPVGRTNNPTDGPISPLNLYRRKNLSTKPESIVSSPKIKKQ
jgi:hypothetical protein